MKVAVLIPSYNPGSLLNKTVQGVLKEWPDVLVVIDGSTDGSDAGLEELSNSLLVHRLPENMGKGAAVLEGINLLARKGYTHALTMDADCQHPPASIKEFMAAGERHPEALVLGEPVFGEDAPSLRVQGRKVSNAWANLETLWWGIHDSLFGMRLYPIEPLQEIFASTRGGRRFDFEPEIAVRFCWKGIPVVNIKTPVRYLSEEEGGVSQFRYLRDNTLLTWMHLRLFLGFLIRLPILLFRSSNPLKNDV